MNGMLDLCFTKTGRHRETQKGSKQVLEFTCLDLSQLLMSVREVKRHDTDDELYI